jgi:hypothetical protein
MMDYTYPSVFFAYLFFALCAGLAAFFFAKTVKDGYWGARGEDVKYTVFDEDGQNERSAS